MKMLVYSYPGSCNLCIVNAESHLQSPIDVDVLLEQYECGVCKYGTKDGELLQYNNANWLMVNIDEEYSARAVKTAYDEYWRLISKKHFERALKRIQENSVYGLKGEKQ